LLELFVEIAVKLSSIIFDIQNGNRYAYTHISIHTFMLVIN